MNSRERRDLPYLVGAGAVVAAVFVDYFLQWLFG